MVQEHIKDELLESIKLGGVKLILSEFLPSDRNTLEAIGQKLMSKRTLHGEFVTMLMDEWPESTTFTSEKRCNSVRVLDSQGSEYIACEASMQDPDDVVEQEEIIGMFMSHEGHVIYGCEMTHIGEDDLSDEPTASLDHLARVITDLMNDSSLLMDTLLTHHQRAILDCIFKGTPNSRYKFLGLLATSIDPQEDDMDFYMDGEEHQNEMEQILDNMQLVHYIPKKDTRVFLGDGGMLIVSPSWKEYETLMTFYSLLRSAEIFVDGLFNRMSLLGDELTQVVDLLERTTEGDYTVITKAQNILTDATANYTILTSTEGYLHRGFAMIAKRWEQAADTVDQELRKKLGVDSGFTSIIERINDIELVLNSIKNEVEGLQTLLSTQIEQQMRRVYSALRDNTRSTSEVIRASERTGDVLNIIQLVLSGTIAFDIVLAITGEYITPYAAWAPDYPLLFFGSAIALWFMIVIGLKKSMDWMSGRVEKDHLVRHALNQVCDPADVERYLASKVITAIDEEIQEDRESIRTHFICEIPDSNSSAEVTLTYDRLNGVLQDIVIESQSGNFKEIERSVLRELQSYLTCEER
ncbi:MAG: hypothetical protein ACW98Y_14705 [Candidatus Thorarchaeota archaeon]|jgi:hypothetical protein